MDAIVLHELLSYLVPGIVLIALGAPLVKVIASRLERRPPASSELASIDARLTRIETAVDAIAVEVERVAEAQRFSARLQAERLPGTQGSARPSDQERR